MATSRCERIVTAMLRFDPVLAVHSRFTEQELVAAGLKAGPCAMGPTPDVEPTSMHVWVFQHVQGGLAMASGDARRDPVFETEPDPRWKVRTLLDPGSKEFEASKPAIAKAIAVLGNGEDVLEWSQAVMIEPRSPFRGNDPS
jgi:hypothetical protein